MEQPQPKVQLALLAKAEPEGLVDARRTRSLCLCNAEHARGAKLCAALAAQMSLSPEEAALQEVALGMVSTGRVARGGAGASKGASQGKARAAAKTAAEATVKPGAANAGASGQRKPKAAAASSSASADKDATSSKPSRGKRDRPQGQASGKPGKLARQALPDAAAAAAATATAATATAVTAATATAAAPGSVAGGMSTRRPKAPAAAHFPAGAPQYGGAEVGGGAESAAAPLRPNPMAYSSMERPGPSNYMPMQYVYGGMDGGPGPAQTPGGGPAAAYSVSYPAPGSGYNYSSGNAYPVYGAPFHPGAHVAAPPAPGDGVEYDGAAVARAPAGPNGAPGPRAAARSAGMPPQGRKPAPSSRSRSKKSKGGKKETEAGGAYPANFVALPASEDFEDGHQLVSNVLRDYIGKKPPGKANVRGAAPQSHQLVAGAPPPPSAEDDDAPNAPGLARAVPNASTGLQTVEFFDAQDGDEVEQTRPYPEKIEELTDAELASIDRKDLQRMMAAGTYTEEEKQDIKRKRRQSKNRISAKGAVNKKRKEAHNLAIVNNQLVQLIEDLRRQNATLQTGNQRLAQSCAHSLQLSDERETMRKAHERDAARLAAALRGVDPTHPALVVDPPSKDSLVATTDTAPTRTPEA